eukprot:6856654-Alexandrium_andersonii.AAC.1
MPSIVVQRAASGSMRQHQQVAHAPATTVTDSTLYTVHATHQANKQCQSVHLASAASDERRAIFTDAACSACSSTVPATCER